jgi:hypothetical protein
VGSSEYERERKLAHSPSWTGDRRRSKSSGEEKVRWHIHTQRKLESEVIESTRADRSCLGLAAQKYSGEHKKYSGEHKNRRANSQQGNPTENTKSDQMKGGANSPEPVAAIASTQEQNGERTQTGMEETPRQPRKRIEADAGRSNPGREKRNRRRTRPAHWTESTNEEHFRSEPETKS